MQVEPGDALLMRGVAHGRIDRRSGFDLQRRIHENHQIQIRLRSGLSSGYSKVSTGRSFSCALSTAGGLQCWGKNDSGQLGQDHKVDKPAAAAVGLTSGVSAFCAGGAHVCAVTTAGVAKCWGNGQYGQLGNGLFDWPSWKPVDVSGEQPRATVEVPRSKRPEGATSPLHLRLPV